MNEERHLLLGDASSVFASSSMANHSDQGATESHLDESHALSTAELNSLAYAVQMIHILRLARAGRHRVRVPIPNILKMTGSPRKKNADSTPVVVCSCPVAR